MVPSHNEDNDRSFSAQSPPLPPFSSPRVKLFPYLRTLLRLQPNNPFLPIPMAIYNLALILKSPQKDAEFLLVKQTRPPKFDDEEYDSYVDSDLWDLPWTQLNLLEGEPDSPIEVGGGESWSEKIELRKFDVNLALNQVLMELLTLFPNFFLGFI